MPISGALCEPFLSSWTSVILSSGEFHHAHSIEGGLDMVHAGLMGGGSRVMKVHSWIMRGVHNSGYVTTPETNYLHLGDVQATELRWRVLLELLGLPMESVVIDEEGSSIFIDLARVKMTPGSFGIMCILRAKGSTSTYLICYHDGHVELCSDNQMEIMAIRKVASRLALLLID
ncbi:MAG: hypothetical protein UZ21_OP11001000967 [Microgenomates bacterium OLB22]|nr:MAG: hypothetical protein UZ21_OP11001000967 [Microgenomates bacterium OLB22]